MNHTMRGWAFFTEVPHKMHGDHTKCVVITQNTRHFLHEGLAEGKPFMSLFLFEVFLMTEMSDGHFYSGT